MSKRLPCLTLIALCLVLRLPARADETHDKLRALIRLPGMTYTFYFAYSPLAGYTLSTEADTPKDTPTSLRKTLHGDATDALLYYRIGALYDEAVKPIEAFVAYTKSVALYREQVKAAPADGAKRAHLVLALHQAQHKPERDQAMADAILHTPNDPQVWEARAQIEFADANTVLSERAESLNEASVPFRLATLLKLSHPKEKVRAALHLLEEAKADYDKAVAIAPEDWHGYSNRYMMRPTYQIETTLLNEALQDKLVSEEKATGVGTEYARLLMTVDSMSDLTTAARVNREQPFALGMAAYFLVLQEGRRKPEGFDFKHGGMMTRMPEADQKTARDLLARMETLTHSANPTLAGQSALALGINQIMLLSPEQGRASVLRAQALLPDDPNVVESLIATYLMEEKYADAQIVLKDALRRRESVRWRLFLAKAEAHQDHWEDVEQDVSIALKNEPRNLDVNLAQCAVLLHKASDDAGKLAYSAQAQHTRELFGSTFTADQKFSFNYLGGLFYALNGDTAEARSYLKDAQGTEEQNADVKAVLALLP